MEFRFDVHSLFNQPIIRVNSNLLPIGFRGDRRLALDTATKMAEIINEMGHASARAQGLSNPVTTAQKLRMTDQNIYLLGDSSQGRNGCVIGLLKVGKKSLYVFDENGQTQMVDAPCVLDFYVHESRQRAGLGKDLFDTMLQQEEYKPEKLAVDRPSDKLLGFLRKHYGLQKTIPQMNNFVVYDGFFERPKAQETNIANYDNRMHITASPNTALFGPQFIIDEQNKRAKAQQNASNTSIPLIQNSPVGRYAAPRPMCSMAECLSGGEIDQNMNKSSPSDENLSKHLLSNIGANIANIANIDNTANVTNDGLNISSSNMNQKIGSNLKLGSSAMSVNRLSVSNSDLGSKAVSSAVVNREKAVDLPSQNYNQYGDMQTPSNEAMNMPFQAVHTDINPAEPIGTTTLPNQEMNPVQGQGQMVPVENSSEMYHKVCPHCSAIFPSLRNSMVKVAQSKISVSNQQDNVVNNEANDSIIHNTATSSTDEPNSSSNELQSATEPYHAVINETVNIDTVNFNIENLQLSEHEGNEYNHGNTEQHEERKMEDRVDLSNGHRQHKDHEVKIDPIQHFIEEEVIEPIIEAVHIQKPTSFPLSKQHTGLKNISYNVSLAVSPTNKMEFIEKHVEESKSRCPLEDKAAGLPSHESIDAESKTPSPGGGAFTDQGYFDLKFYHNKLW